MIDGRTILDKHLVSIPNDQYVFDVEKQMQPNGFDLRVVSISTAVGSVTVPAEQHVDYSQMIVNRVDCKDGYFSLKANQNYVVNYRESISVKDGFAAIIVGRSSLLRAGIFITSALYDTGFEGQLGGVIRPMNNAKIQFGARLGQVIFHESKFNGMRYQGRYQGTNSQEAFMTNG